MDYLKKYFGCFLATFLSNCTNTKVEVYIRDDVKTSNSNIVAFPALLLEKMAQLVLPIRITPIF